MESEVANVDGYTFEIERNLDNQLHAKTLPFAGMDKSQFELCNHFLRGHCPRGALCPFRHSRQDATIVCKHWLRHLCKKGDDCEFLHLYDMMRMPECHYFQKSGECNNKDCPFLHGDQDVRTKDCPWFNRGFCKHGPNCRNRHSKQVMCVNYLCGFCPEGLRCKHAHAKWDLGVEAGRPAVVTSVPMATESTNVPVAPVTGQATYRPLDQVTCYKCKQKGHYANVCPQSYRMRMLVQQNHPSEGLVNVT